MLRQGLLLLVLLPALLMLSGCADPQVRLGLSSTANLNLNDFDEPLPVVVRVYQLNDEANFLNADFADLWKDDLRTLGNSLLTRDEIVMNPAAQMALEYPRHEQTRFVAVMGVFRKPGDNNWRDIRPLPEGFFSRRLTGTLRVHLKGNTLEMVD
ncbi:type VI secretion system lipoprotein TssJ [Geoalkalibacter halelectricus]|uniref:type VI secretion system lipoprotein TssJ n=1 Tax=Geoalkalibacter halelectricus TaxID=2847045 RepID=UPI003D19ED01